MKREETEEMKEEEENDSVEVVNNKVLPDSTVVYNDSDMDLYISNNVPQSMSKEDTQKNENEEERKETMNTEQEAGGGEQNAIMRAARLTRFGGEGATSRRVLQNAGDGNNDNDSDSEE